MANVSRKKPTIQADIVFERQKHDVDGWSHWSWRQIALEMVRAPPIRFIYLGDELMHEAR